MEGEHRTRTGASRQEREGTTPDCLKSREACREHALRCAAWPSPPTHLRRPHRWHADGHDRGVPADPDDRAGSRAAARARRISAQDGAGRPYPGPSLPGRPRDPVRPRRPHRRGSASSPATTGHRAPRSGPRPDARSRPRTASPELSASLRTSAHFRPALVSLRRVVTAATARSSCITGGNSGIGLETAVALARDGARVVITSRDAERGAAAARPRSRPGAATRARSWPSTSRRSRRCARSPTSSPAPHDRLDVLVDNAGVILKERRVTEDGHEMQFQTNHLGHFLLTNLLRDRLVASAPARVVVVASDAHRFARQGSRLRRPRVDTEVPVVPHLQPDEADEHPVRARARPSSRRHRRHRECGASRASSRAASRATATPASWATSAWCSGDRSRGHRNRARAPPCSSRPRLDSTASPVSTSRSRSWRSRPPRLVTTSRRRDSGMVSVAPDRVTSAVESAPWGRWTGRLSSSPVAIPVSGWKPRSPWLVMGATVIITARNADRGAAAQREIQSRSGSGCEVMALDLASFASIRAFADRLTGTHDRLDVLVLNAGGVLANRELTEDGHERQFQANHLGHFLLTALLREHVVAAAPARIVVVASVRAQEPQTPDRLRRHRRRVDSIQRVPDLLPHEADEHPLRARVVAAPRRHERHGELAAPRVRREQVRP